MDDLAAIERVYVAGRGVVYTVTTPAVRPQIGESVRIDGTIWRVTGIEEAGKLLHLNVGKADGEAGR